MKCEITIALGETGEDTVYTGGKSDEDDSCEAFPKEETKNYQGNPDNVIRRGGIVVPAERLDSSAEDNDMMITMDQLAQSTEHC